MAQGLKDSFLDLERHRQLLETNIEKLRKSLRHWQTWEAEYEGLKEEIVAIQPSPSRSQLTTVGRDYEGELVTKAEVDDILGITIPRDTAQVTNILERRIDYVQQNVKTIEKQLELAEKKLAAATIISTPEVMNEDGLPMTEIVEDLDEEGNVIASHTTTPGSTKDQLLEVLQKAGVKDLPSLNYSLLSAEASTVQAIVDDTNKDLVESAIADIPSRKSVSFSDDTKPGPDLQKTDTANRIENIRDLAKQQNDDQLETPIIPSDDSPQDAALRKEMLQYHMAEIGAVVAELDLEDGSEFSDEDFEEEDAGSMDEEEDQFGRSTRQVVDETMRQRMMELEQRLGIRMMENVGPKPDSDIVDEGIGQIRVRPKNEKPSASDSEKVETSSSKKGVRFAEELNISRPAPESAQISSLSMPIKGDDIPAQPPLTDIVERNAPRQSTPASASKKVSRFKTSQTPNIPAAPLLPYSAPNRERTVPTGPSGTTLASGVVEREIPDRPVTEPDELDPALLQQEVATEYHRMRNTMIQRQGGFTKRETVVDPDGRIELEEEEGGPKRVSRFKAARLARQ